MMQVSEGARVGDRCGEEEDADMVDEEGEKGSNSNSGHALKRGPWMWEMERIHIMERIERCWWGSIDHLCDVW